MRSLKPIVYLALSFSAACGGGDSSQFTGTHTNTVTNGIFRATIDGKPWSPVGKVSVIRETTSISMFAASPTTRAMNILCLNVSGPGTTVLNDSPSNGSHAGVSEAGAFGWNTRNTGGTGSVVITLLTASHIVGTFSFDAPESGAGGEPALHVTNGSFDLFF